MDFKKLITNILPVSQNQAKTGYTYSKSKSYRDSVTPDRRVGSPNMSRRALRNGSVRSDNTDTLSQATTVSAGADYDRLTLRSRTVDRTPNHHSDFEDKPDTPVRGSSSRQQKSSYFSEVTHSEEVRKVIPFGTGTPPETTRRLASPIVRQKDESHHTTHSTTNGCHHNLSNGSLNTNTSHTYNPQPNILVRWWYSITIMTTTVITTMSSFVQSSTKGLVKGVSSCLNGLRHSEPRKRYPVNTTTVTSSTWLRQKVTSLSHFYADRRTRSPCLWLWLPLLLLLLLLPLLAFWWHSEEDSMMATLPKHTETGSLYLKELSTSVYGGLSHSISVVGSLAFGALSTLWTYLCWASWGLWAFVAAYTKDSVASFVNTSRAVSSPEHVVYVNPQSDPSPSHAQVLQYLMGSHEFGLYLDQRLNSEITKALHQSDQEKETFKMDLEGLKLDVTGALKSGDLEKIMATLSTYESKQQYILSKLQEMQDSMDLLKEDLKSKAKDENPEKVVGLEAKMTQMNNEMAQLKDSLQMEQSRMMTEISKCCQQSPLTLSDVQQHMLSFFASLLGVSQSEGDPLSLETLGETFKKDFMTKEEFEERMLAIKSAIKEDISEDQKVLMEKLQVSIDEEILQKYQVLTTQISTQMNNNEKSESSLISANFNTTELEEIVNKLINKYDADKTGMPDHALESAGGTVISTRCTEGYTKHFADIYVFGVSVYRYPTNSPRSIIQPSRNPGECWAFKGSQGDALIQLAAPVRLTGFTMEHIPKSLSPQGTIESAPRNFSVYGLFDQHTEGFLLGDYEYRDDGNPLQYFPVRNPRGDYFPLVELKVLSNHGNVKFTCVYRFRVHGVREYS